MSSFVHVDQPLSHPGVARAEQVIGYVQEQSRQFNGTRGLSAVLLAAIVAALVAVADKFVTHWTDGSLLAAWMVMWLVAFLAMALFAGAARNVAASAACAKPNAPWARLIPWAGSMPMNVCCACAVRSS